MRTKPPKLWRFESAPLCPVAVPKKIFGLSLFLDFFDRCHSLLLASSAAGSARSRPHFDTAAYSISPRQLRYHTTFLAAVQLCGREKINKKVLTQPISADPTYLIYQILGACVKAGEEDSAFYTRSFLYFLYSLPS